ncbi:aminomethyl-transferring glycine dehydrogenase subunit GcvPA [Kitasatospora sp. NPDC056273]|uniref:aminomethyl-transferring glycine dehydrogenase subunit GcvPA n=1 Tax=unclassified Kitasatospora TaxID=2633591 RepID=UPI0035DF8CBB
MSTRVPRTHPYIPNSAPQVRKAMLAEVGAQDVEEFYADIPAALRLDRPLRLPEPLGSEARLVAHMEELLSRNTAVPPGRSFLGAGCYRHHVPAVVDEIVNRSEFLTAYAGEPYEDHGRFQALWEYQSLMAELLAVDVVNVPTYDGFQAAATALRMAGRATGRRRLVLVGAIDPDRISRIRDYVRGVHELVLVPADPAAVRAALAEGDAAAVYAQLTDHDGRVDQELPSYIELAHQAGALAVAHVHPLSLGVLTPPAELGADLTCGDLQPLGIHPSYGGGNAGFIGSPDDERLVAEYPSRLFGLVPTDVPGEYGFGDVAYERTSFAVREEGKEWVGTAAALHGIAAGVYLTLMGPHGMREIGGTILANTAYARQRLAEVPGVELADPRAVHFADFTVRYTGERTAAETAEALLARGLHGGTPVGADGAAAREGRYCVTELHTRADIDRLADALEEIAK